MELAAKSRVIVETTPACQEKVAHILTQLGAVMRRFSSCPKGSGSFGGRTDSDVHEVIIEAVIEPSKTNSVVQALGSVCSDGSAVTISVLDMVAPRGSSERGDARGDGGPREQKWGDYLITL
jgi:hypothetical protein